MQGKTIALLATIGPTGPVWCQWEGYWWHCDPPTSFHPSCTRGDKLPAEVK